jgi:hypothetical protein
MLWKSFLRAVCDCLAKSLVSRWRRRSHLLSKVMVLMPKVTPAIGAQESEAAFEK